MGSWAGEAGDEGSWAGGLGMKLIPHCCSTSSVFFSLLMSGQTVLLLQHVSSAVCDGYSRSGFTHIHACLYTYPTHMHASGERCV